MHPRFRLLGLLADGGFHSGEALGSALDLSRAGVWKLAQGVKDLGVDLLAVPGRGYRLGNAFEPLDSERIVAGLTAEERRRLAGIEVLPTVDSTNRALAVRAAAGAPSGTACLAEHQSGGRGRRGRAWVSPYGANLYLSLLWRFQLAPAALGPLSVAVGVMVNEALADLGAAGVGLKWPNDVLWRGRKLAGVLIEVAGEATGPAQVVIGVGVNAHMPPAAGEGIEQPWVDLRTVLGRPVDRNLLAARVLARLAAGLERFSREGFAPFREAWDRLDLACGRPVTVVTGDGSVAGRCLGLDDSGALLVETGGRAGRFLSGEVSLRLPA
jgi:BirA family biotin operon repressor/biotin-[acetyl-CoA-carboxylase] ligase